MSSIASQDPLTAAGVVAEWRSLAVNVLRLWHPQAPLIAGLGQTFGVSWPIEPNTVARGSVDVLWTGPAEWTLVGGDDRDVATRVQEVCGDGLYHLARIGCGRIVIDVDGSGARDLLAKGCSLDLHPRMFTTERCAQTLFAQLPVLLYQQSRGGESTSCFRLVTDVSYNDWIRSWIARAIVD